eukprot:202898_1
MSAQYKKCISFAYDLSTIIISIADVTTDIIVLISFYNKQRITFFVLSLIILIVAHIAYSFTFLLRYHIGDACDNECCWFGVFLLLLPFGSLISFFIYFTDNPDSPLASTIHDITGLDMKNTIAINHHNPSSSKMTQFMIQKLSKHMGFIMEAGIEALPQSLLQMVAIVYYKEANYISIASIFLSMFSVMSKSLVFSQGIDIKTYIWTWLCIVVDFFGIFFTLSYVFYTSDKLLQPVYHGYFTIIGQIWLYKVLISIIPIIIIAIMYWFLYKMWVIIIHDWSPNSTCFKNFCSTAFYSLGGSFGVLIAVFVGFIALEIFCFSFLALILFFGSTKRWMLYKHETVTQTVNSFIHFVGKSKCYNKNNDRILRIIAINRHVEHNESLNKYLDTHNIQDIGYKNIRNNCGNAQRIRNVKIYPLIWDIFDELSATVRSDYRNMLCNTVRYTLKERIANCGEIIGVIIFPILFTVFTMSKIFQIFFPYIIISYLSYWKHWNEIDTFQIIMLMTYVGLQIILFLFGIIVVRIHWWLWYIVPGANDINVHDNRNVKEFMIAIEKDYVDMAWLPIIEKILINKYGDDISHIIMDFLASIDVTDD